jgi:hypothetical protein
MLRKHKLLVNLSLINCQMVTRFIHVSFMNKELHPSDSSEQQLAHKVLSLPLLVKGED